MTELWEQIEEAATEIQLRWPRKPRLGIILGTGLGRFTEQIEKEAVLSYGSIPHFPRSTAIGHKGQLVCGLLQGIPVVTMEGRFHAYEGYSLQQVTLPVRVMHKLGIEWLLISNASGGMNPKYLPGDVMILNDHINLMGDNPLIGFNDLRLGPRFPDMSSPYDRVLSELALRVAEREGIRAHQGVYVALKGPNYETRAEYRFLRLIGGDVVGMSTVPEVIVANHMKLRVLAISVVTNVADPDDLTPSDGHEVAATAGSAEDKLRRIVLGVVGEVFPDAARK